MHTILHAAVGSIALAAVFAAAPAASAAPSATASVAETIDGLRAQGYNVQVNGTRAGPLSNCSVEAVRGPFSTSPGSTVYVDLSCPAEYMY
ncbi:hypothetical protein [Mycolicibacterium diernhoferi]|uniref:PASTA domain-containing protein n=1 Tax=Mycolicibacterium diernhoferi TaxID=1801 RepID=A0A1Q4HLY4_9MYCO|nr:hypothetical protein [Mycolicibacterium diernhoferi]OJZ68523.1 hypothetical protein BRW64_02840 [Mycolicibacterium diernhoferi]OPE56153.1 hypothetical protein BV510_01185 [Mycolicibacterium diernhoferi]PEG54458.1 hypothetical protein CRI78_11245 [Mycolicibacterium diernhoferi]QYL20976.1 hypothetical protein K0O62_18185 [Mycolicibacterium diernhoferi]